ncbi:MAG: DNA repair protein RecN [Clostridiales Family XIII bacterium]|nr:DNA repair protein RecN [Clostridiales Family XIII bacterium]
MIHHIAIRDFAIISELDVDLFPGLSVITGETGAGKSIIIEAVSLALGSRADSAMVRAGRPKAVIQIAAELPDGAGGVSEIILTREISANGKSLAKINGEMVSLSQLSAFSARLADIHGQYDHHSLFRTENHLSLVDSFHAAEIVPAKAEVAAAWREHSAAARELSSLLENEASAKRQLDFMRFELDEITKARPMPGEDAALREQLAILQNSGAIHDGLSAAWDILYDNAPSVMDALGRAMQELQAVSGYSKELGDISQSISDCYFTLEDLTGSIRACRERIDFSPESLNAAIARLDLIEALCAKYGGSVETMLEHKEKLTETLDTIENFDEHKAKLAALLAERETVLLKLSESLHGLRKKSAEELEAKINAELSGLNFSNARFAVDFRETGDPKRRFSENGTDVVEFLISANKGQPLLPLAKVASGGEMSRMLLAFKAVTGDYDHIPTLIFDEIDSGISGVTASIVGEKLIKMAENRQIVCITHLPQIAACGRHHYSIQKNADDETTYTTLEALGADARIREIARLLGGAAVTEKTLESARELIELSGNAGS